MGSRFCFMNKTISLECGSCKQMFTMLVKDHALETKKGRFVFFCSLACAAHANVVIPITITKNKSKKRIRKTAKVNGKYSEEYAPFAKYYWHCKKRKQWEIDIDVQYLKQLWEQQSGICALTGIPMQKIGETTNKNIMASLDRKDSSKGYVKGNVQFVVCTADSSIEEFITLIKTYSKPSSTEQPANPSS
jgi:hypothetical protein